MAARRKVADVGSRAHRGRKILQRAQHILRSLIGKLLAFEEVIVNAEAEALLREAPVDVVQYSAGCIACDVLHTENFRESQRALEFLRVVNRRAVVGDAT